jgi:membrane carboxypeptidase/penicillin-binding protein PbpC
MSAGDRRQGDGAPGEPERTEGPVAAAVGSPTSGARTTAARIRRSLRRAGIAGVALFAFAFLGERLVDVFWPYPLERLRAMPTSPVVVAADGTWLRVVPTPAGERVLPLPWNEAPDALRALVLSAEDERFFRHTGVDWLAVLRATISNVAAGRVVSGASTITMQVVRIVEPRPRTLWSKCIEAIRARQLERILTKEEIASLWLEQVPIGGTLRGFEAAARYWFGCSAHELDAASAASLVAMVPAPSTRSPQRDAVLLQAFRDQILAEALDKGALPHATVEAALSRDLGMTPRGWPWFAQHASDAAWRAHLDGVEERGVAAGGRSPRRAEPDAEAHLPGAQRPRPVADASSALPHPVALDRVALHRVALHRVALHPVALHRATPTEDPGGRVQGTADDASREPPLRPTRPVLITTDIDFELQRRVQDLVRARDDLPGDGLAVVVVDRRTGTMPVVVGDRDPWAPLDLSTCRRSAGSTLKPFLYALARERGALAVDALVDDLPQQYDAWEPANFDRDFLGRTQAGDALATSSNLAAVRCLEAVGPEPFAELLAGLGLRAPDRPLHLDAALGTDAVSPQGLALAYWRFVERPDALGLSRASVDWTLQALRRLPLVPGRLPAGEVAWKSGTSSGRRDAWCVGVVDRHVVVVWLGNRDGRGLTDLVGIRSAGAVLADVLAVLPRG